MARAGFAEQDGWPSFHHTGPRFAAGTPTLTNSPQTKAGTFFYHSHDHPDRQQGLGLYGAFIIDPRERGRDESKADLAYVIQLQKWLVRDRLTHPAMLMEGGLPNYFTINRRAYPSTDVVHMKVGPTVKLRFIGTSNNFIHPMHVHGGPFTIVARDGVTLSPSARYDADTINLGP